MTANRRAELQRKLAVAPVEKPPAGLAARIKDAIPKDLRFNAEIERKRLAQSVRMSMAVAASVIVVIAVSYLGLRVTTNTRVDQSKPAAAASPVRAVPPPQVIPEAPAPPVFAVEQRERVQSKEAATRHLKKKQEAPFAAEAAKATDSVAPESEVAAGSRQALEEDKAEVRPAPVPAVAQSISSNAAAPAAKMDRAAAPAAKMAARDEAIPEAQRTISPVSGKDLVAEGKNVIDAPQKTRMALTPWKDTSRETKIQILKEELARGAEPGEVARVAREAGLNEFADSIEKKEHH